MDKNNNLYKCLDSYMVRTPLIPFNKYLDIFRDKNNNLNEYIENMQINEAILVASKSFYKSLQDVDMKDFEKEKLKYTFLKYMIRMTARTTPYGLFSGVCLSTFGVKSSIDVNSFKNKHKYLRIDMGWIFQLIKSIEENEDILLDLYVCSNNLSYNFGDRLENPYISNCGNSDFKKSNLSASIKFSEKVKMAMEKSDGGIKVRHLISELNDNNKYDEKQILKFIKNLIKNEYLITNLRPPLTNTNVLEYIINILSNICSAEYISKSLKIISDTIDQYNKSEVGEGIDLYKKIIDEMKNINLAENYLQVDFKYNNNQVILTKDIKNSIERIGEVLLKLSCGCEYPGHLSEYAEDFLERYGEYREINVVELLNPDIGLGAPSGYIFPRSTRHIKYTHKNDSLERYKNIVTNKSVISIRKKERKLNLTDEDLDFICGEKSKKWNMNILPSSLDLNIFINSNSIEEIEKGNYELFIGPNYGSNFAGKMFGRFSHMFKDSELDIFKHIDESTNKIQDDTILVEITELPMSGRASNVTLNNNFRDYELALGTNYSGKKLKIRIDDIYVGLDENNRFYLKSKSLNKKILITSNHMLNTAGDSNICKFMREISQESRIGIFDPLFENNFGNLDYIPRICYKNIVISPESWKIRKDIFNFKNKNLNLEIENLNKFINDFNIPQFVYAGKDDNRLLLNLKNKDHMMILISEIKKSNDYLFIREPEFMIDNIWINNPLKDKYISEFVFSLVLNTKSELLKKESNFNSSISIKTKSDISKNKSDITTYSNERISTLFDDWICFKFYIQKNRTNEFLSVELDSLCNDLLSKKFIKKFFYIRYADPNYHIRFRIKKEKLIDLTQIFNEVKQWINRQKDIGIMIKFTIDEYYKELERYGGIESFTQVEDVFYYDSLVSIELLKLMNSNKLSLNKDIIKCINMIGIMDGFGISFKEQNDLFQYLFDRHLFKDRFRKSSKDFIYYCDNRYDWENLKNCEDGLTIYNIINMRKLALNNYFKKIDEVDEKGNLTNSKENIIMSIIHMSCNRLLDSRDEEQLIMHLVRHCLHSLKYYNKEGK